MKLFFALCVLSFSVFAEPLVPTFKYLDDVYVKSGFYEGYEAKVIDYGCDEKECFYSIGLTVSNTMIFVEETNLEYVNNPKEDTFNN